jgi:hypothetical protein
MIQLIHNTSRDPHKWEKWHQELNQLSKWICSNNSLFNSCKSVNNQSLNRYVYSFENDEDAVSALLKFNFLIVHNTI